MSILKFIFEIGLSLGALWLAGMGLIALLGMATGVFMLLGSAVASIVAKARSVI